MFLNISWRKIKRALADIENYNSYFVGGSLCIDFHFHPNVMLNKNGRGCAYDTKVVDVPTMNFVMAPDVQEKVKLLYLKYMVCRHATNFD